MSGQSAAAAAAAAAAHPIQLSEYLAGTNISILDDRILPSTAMPLWSEYAGSESDGQLIRVTTRAKPLPTWNAACQELGVSTAPVVNSYSKAAVLFKWIVQHAVDLSSQPFHTYWNVLLGGTSFRPNFTVVQQQDNSTGATLQHDIVDTESLQQEAALVSAQRNKCSNLELVYSCHGLMHSRLIWFPDSESRSCGQLECGNKHTRLARIVTAFSGASVFAQAILEWPDAFRFLQTMETNIYCHCTQSKILKVFGMQHRSGMWLGPIGSTCIIKMAKKDCSATGAAAALPDLQVVNEPLLRSLRLQQKRHLCTVEGCEFVLFSSNQKCPVHTELASCATCGHEFWLPSQYRNYCSQSCRPVCAVQDCEAQDLITDTRCAQHHFESLCKVGRCSTVFYNAIGALVPSRCSQCTEDRVCISCETANRAGAGYDVCYSCKFQDCAVCGRKKAKIGYLKCYECFRLLR
jgi:hypothetical protein